MDPNFVSRPAPEIIRPTLTLQQIGQSFLPLTLPKPYADKSHFQPFSEVFD